MRQSERNRPTQQYTQIKTMKFRSVILSGMASKDPYPGAITYRRIARLRSITVSNAALVSFGR